MGRYSIDSCHVSNQALYASWAGLKETSKSRWNQKEQKHLDFKKCLKHLMIQQVKIRDEGILSHL